MTRIEQIITEKLKADSDNKSTPIYVEELEPVVKITYESFAKRILDYIGQFTDKTDDELATLVNDNYAILVGIPYIPNALTGLDIKEVKEWQQ